MKVIVTDECIACGMCENICPQVFCVEDKAEVVGPAEEYSSQVEEAAAACPVNAIEIS